MKHGRITRDSIQSGSVDLDMDILAVGAFGGSLFSKNIGLGFWMDFEI